MARFVKKAWLMLAFVFGIVQMVITLFHATVPIDATGGYFSIDLMSAPIIGYLLGPLYGAVSVFLGTFVAALVDPLAVYVIGPFGLLGGLLVGLPLATGAFVAGLIKNGRYRIVPLVFIISIGLFLTTRVGLLVFSFLWLHFIALLLSVLFLVPQLKEHLESGLNLSAGTNYSKAAIAIWLLVFISLMADHIMASVMRACLFLSFTAPLEWSLSIYTEIVLIYPIERIFASIVGALVIILIAVAVTRTNLHLPTHPITGREGIPIESRGLEDSAKSGSIEEAVSKGSDSQ